MKTKVAIFGTSANPITLSHISICESVLNSSLVDEIWLMPCGNHLFKHDLLDAKHRVEMCKLATAHNKNIKVFTYEIDNMLSGSSYELFENLIYDGYFKNYEFSMIIGLDHANVISTFKNYEKLLKLIPFIVIPRAGIEFGPLWYLKEPHKLLNINIGQCSSTEVRNAIKTQNFEKIEKFLNSSIISYIKQYNLYVDKNIEEENMENLETTDGQELKPDLSNYNPAIYNKPSVTVDICICRYVNKVVEVLLIKRAQEPFKDSWAIPGGFLQIVNPDILEGQESLETAAARELKEETGVEGVEILELKSYSNPTRDPRMRIITIVFYALLDASKITNQNIVAGDDAKEVGWFPLKTPGVNLAFDHNIILTDLYNRLQGKVSYTPIAFQLLGKEFSWASLKGVYEYLLDKTLIEPNFRRKMTSMYILKPVSIPEKRKIKTNITGRPSALLKFGGEIDKGF